MFSGYLRLCFLRVMSFCSQHQVVYVMSRKLHQFIQAVSIGLVHVIIMTFCTSENSAFLLVEATFFAAGSTGEVVVQVNKHCAEHPHYQLNFVDDNN